MNLGRVNNNLVIYIFILCISGANFTNSSIESKSIKKHIKICGIGIPKCGTWLLDKLFTLLAGSGNVGKSLLPQGVLRFYAPAYFIEPSISEELKFIKFYQAPPDAAQLFTPSIKILKTCLELLDDEHIISHLVYNEVYEKIFREINCKVILIIRDPRDQVVSRAYYARQNAEAFPGLQDLSLEELISGYIGINALKEQQWPDLLTGHIGYPLKPKFSAFSNVTKFYGEYFGWMKSPLVLVVRFENLVGELGGGSKKEQIKEIVKIAHYLNISLTLQQAAVLGNQLYGGTGSFREGKIGSWKKKFTNYQKDQFKKIAGKMLIEWGYEKNLNW